MKVWASATLASILLHGAGLTALAFSTDPDILPDQPVPDTWFSIEAAEVPRSRAAPETPQGDTADQAEPSSAAVQPGTVPQTNAQPAALSTTVLQNAEPEAQSLKSDVAAGTIALSAGSSTAEILAPSAPPLGTLASLDTQPALLSAAQPIAPDRTAALPPSTPSIPTLTPTAQPALSARTEVPQSDALPLPSQPGTASLAFSTDSDTPVSATSLAAITAFTQAGDLSAATAEVRDGIAGILAAVPCARLQTTFLPDTGELELRGHIPEDALRGPVLAALQEQIGDAIALSDQLLILPRPQCGALSGIADVGLPQSTEQLSDPAVIGEDGFARTYTYRNGERLRLDLTAPDYDAYIYMDYFVADGSVIHLQPNDIVPLEFATAKSAQSVGRERSGKPFLELTISPPFGQEIAAAFAASVPLYDGVRPLQEPAEEYLAFLKERVAATRATHPDFKGEWVYFFISTKEN